MDFEINGDMWFIEFKSKEELIELYKTEYKEEDVYFVFGLTNKSQHCIWLNKDMQVSQQIKTLKHELTHCYIWEYGLYNVPHFNEEMACDLVSRSNDFINKVVEKFINGGKKKMMEENKC